MFFIKKLKSCFAQGEHNKRHKVLKSIIEAVEEEYREDNYITRTSWLVEELLRNDKNFILAIRSLNSKKCLQKALSNVVEDLFLGR